MKNFVKALSKIALFTVAAFCLYLFCNSQTKGFWLQEILSDPLKPIKPLSEENLPIKALLNQRFTYLGSGEQSHAFLGEDQKTVLKFFKHDHCFPEMHLRSVSFPSFLEPLRQKLVQKRACDLDAIFKSCQIAYEHLKVESGILYLHLNKTPAFFGTTSLIDNLGILHLVDLDQTEFVVQKYAPIFFSKIDELMQEGQLLSAQEAIKLFLNCIDSCHQKGVKINHPAIQRNVGLTEHEVLIFDIGSFKEDPTLKIAENQADETYQVTRRLARWLSKHHPTLLPYYEAELRAKADNAKAHSH